MLFGSTGVTRSPTRQRPGPAPLRRGEGQCGRVGDGVVGEDAERAEADHVAKIDEEGNVLALRKGTHGDGKVVVVSAHLDTVFPADLPHLVRQEDGRLLGPNGWVPEIRVA